MDEASRKTLEVLTDGTTAETMVDMVDSGHVFQVVALSLKFEAGAHRRGSVRVSIELVDFGPAPGHQAKEDGHG